MQVGRGLAIGQINQETEFLLASYLKTTIRLSF
jgi:hypothetical protein